jgi:hypothetical protein
LGVDETGFHNKNMVLTLVERGGSAPLFIRMAIQSRASFQSFARTCAAKAQFAD